MNIIKQSHEILELPDDALISIERAARTCYKSEDKITDTSAIKLVRSLMNSNHNAMIEFADITVKFITNRGITHELVRHRLSSFAQESTRYVKYNDISIIEPVWKDSVSPETYKTFKIAMLSAETAYQALIENGWRPEQAREVLPNALKTEIVMKANIREWRHVLALRCSKKAHPQIRALMLGLLGELHKRVPVLFEDLYIEHCCEVNYGI